MESSLNTIKNLVEITNYPLINIWPNLDGENIWDIMKRSFQRIPKVLEDIKKKRYDRKEFECCTKLKKNPGDNFFHLQQNFVVIDSSCPYESNRRGYYAYEIRKKNTFLRYLKKRKFWKAYPWRDILSEKQFLPYLNFTKKYIPKIKHSGCVICPILIVFRIYNDRYYKSLKAMARAGLPCFQKTIMDFKEI